MRFLNAPLFVLLAASACGSPSSSTLPELPVIADPAFLEQYAQTGGFRLGQPTSITITPDGREVLFLRSGPRSPVRNLYSFDIETGEERALLGQELLADTGELSPEERALRERLRLVAGGVASYQLSKDGARILIPLSGRLFVLERASGELRELPSDGGYANDARFSPNGERVACVREGDLWIIDVAERTQRRITHRDSPTITNGLAEFVAQEEMSRYHGYWWSPDSESLLLQRTDVARVPVWHASNPIAPADEPHAARYPHTGAENADVRLFVLSIDGTVRSEVQWDRAALPYLATVRWSKDHPPLIVVQDRRQQRELVLEVDLASGATSTRLEEEDAAWLNLDQSVPRWTGEDRYLWSTEREGGWQLEVRTPEGKTALTPPDLGYYELRHVADDAAWVIASSDPTERHVWRVPFEGEAEAITREPGYHDAIFGSRDDLWVHASHTVDEGPRWRVRRGNEVVGELRSVADAPPFVPNVEHLEVGERQYRAMVIRPRNFERGRTYPVLLSVYAGPGHNRVRKGRDFQLREQWQADQGFVVVSLDGRGTPGRGRDWERAVRGDLIEIPLADQIEGLRALGERFSELDMDRVGVYGWSFGGYFSAMAVMRHPEVFKVGVAGAPVCDWRDYDTHYTERFMSLPSDNEAGYNAASVLSYTSNLRRPLLIVHGTSDDNVYFVHALKMHDALMRADREHEFIALAGSTHMVSNADLARALQGRIMRFLARGLR
ncbi:MAG: DPP IV N-terminal domain-containing protein [Myxococcota bacterium]